MFLAPINFVPGATNNLAKVRLLAAYKYPLRDDNIWNPADPRDGLIGWNELHAVHQEKREVDPKCYGSIRQGVVSDHPTTVAARVSLLDSDVGHKAGIQPQRGQHPKPNV